MQEKNLPAGPNSNVNETNEPGEMNLNEIVRGRLTNDQEKNFELEINYMETEEMDFDLSKKDQDSPEDIPFVLIGTHQSQVFEQNQYSMQIEDKLVQFNRSQDQCQKQKCDEYKLRNQFDSRDVAKNSLNEEIPLYLSNKTDQDKETIQMEIQHSIQKNQSSNEHRMYQTNMEDQGQQGNGQKNQIKLLVDNFINDKIEHDHNIKEESLSNTYQYPHRFTYQQTSGNNYQQPHGYEKQQFLVSESSDSQYLKLSDQNQGVKIRQQKVQNYKLKAFCLKQREIDNQKRESLSILSQQNIDFSKVKINDEQQVGQKRSQVFFEGQANLLKEFKNESFQVRDRYFEEESQIYKKYILNMKKTLRKQYEKCRLHEEDVQSTMREGNIKIDCMQQKQITNYVREAIVKDDTFDYSKNYYNKLECIEEINKEVIGKNLKETKQFNIPEIHQQRNENIHCRNEQEIIVYEIDHKVTQRNSQQAKQQRQNAVQGSLGLQQYTFIVSEIVKMHPIGQQQQQQQQDLDIKQQTQMVQEQNNTNNSNSNNQTKETNEESIVMRQQQQLGRFVEIEEEVTPMFGMQVGMVEIRSQQEDVIDDNVNGQIGGEMVIGQEKQQKQQQLPLEEKQDCQLKQKVTVAINNDKSNGLSFESLIHGMDEEQKETTQQQQQQSQRPQQQLQRLQRQQVECLQIQIQQSQLQQHQLQKDKEITLNPIPSQSVTQKLNLHMAEQMQFVGIVASGNANDKPNTYIAEVSIGNNNDQKNNHTSQNNDQGRLNAVQNYNRESVQQVQNVIEVKSIQEMTAEQLREYIKNSIGAVTRNNNSSNNNYIMTNCKNNTDSTIVNNTMKNSTEQVVTVNNIEQVEHQQDKQQYIREPQLQEGEGQQELVAESQVMREQESQLEQSREQGEFTQSLIDNYHHIPMNVPITSEEQYNNHDINKVLNRNDNKDVNLDENTSNQGVRNTDNKMEEEGPKNIDEYCHKDNDEKEVTINNEGITSNQQALQQQQQPHHSQQSQQYQQQQKQQLEQRQQRQLHGSSVVNSNKDDDSIKKDLDNNDKGQIMEIVSESSEQSIVVPVKKASVSMEGVSNIQQYQSTEYQQQQEQLLRQGEHEEKQQRHADITNSNQPIQQSANHQQRSITSNHNHINQNHNQIVLIEIQEEQNQQQQQQQVENTNNVPLEATAESTTVQSTLASTAPSVNEEITSSSEDRASASQDRAIKVTAEHVRRQLSESYPNIHNIIQAASDEQILTLYLELTGKQDFITGTPAQQTQEENQAIQQEHQQHSTKNNIEIDLQGSSHNQIQASELSKPTGINGNGNIIDEQRYDINTNRLIDHNQQQQQQQEQYKQDLTAEELDLVIQNLIETNSEIRQQIIRMSREDLLALYKEGIKEMKTKNHQHHQPEDNKQPHHQQSQLKQSTGQNIKDSQIKNRNIESSINNTNNSAGSSSPLTNFRRNRKASSKAEVIDLLEDDDDDNNGQVVNINMNNNNIGSSITHQQQLEPSVDKQNINTNVRVEQIKLSNNRQQQLSIQDYHYDYDHGQQQQALQQPSEKNSNEQPQQQHRLFKKHSYLEEYYNNIRRQTETRLNSSNKTNQQTLPLSLTVNKTLLFKLLQSQDYQHTLQSILKPKQSQKYQLQTLKEITSIIIQKLKQNHYQLNDIANITHGIIINNNNTNKNTNKQKSKTKPSSSSFVILSGNNNSTKTTNIENQFFKHSVSQQNYLYLQRPTITEEKKAKILELRQKRIKAEQKILQQQQKQNQPQQVEGNHQLNKNNAQTLLSTPSYLTTILANKQQHKQIKKRYCLLFQQEEQETLNPYQEEQIALQNNKKRVKLTQMEKDQKKIAQIVKNFTQNIQSPISIQLQNE